MSTFLQKHRINSVESQHCVSPFRLIDSTKPGHRRFIALWLVDPHQPIISTANIPPQQPDWWLDATLSKSPKESLEALKQRAPGLIEQLKRHGLIVNDHEDEAQARPDLNSRDDLDSYFDRSDFFMSYKEARMHRENLMKERTMFTADVRKGWQQYTYNFCEH